MSLNVGAKDPRLKSANQINFRLQHMIKSWKSSYPAPPHVKPIPIQVIQRVASLSQLLSASDFLYQATTDMIILAYFFLLWTGEYTDNIKTQFCLKDVQLFIGPCSLNLQTLSTAELAQACFGSLIRIMVSVAKLLVKPQQATALSDRSRHLCNAFFTSGLTMHPLLHPVHGFSTHRPKLHHQFSLLPSETLSSILAPISDSFLRKSPLEVFGPWEQRPSS
jgi:hypothetical protein